MRLNRFLASAGLGSRRSCEDLVRAGRIEVNGETVTFPGHEVDPAKDKVCADGERLRPPRSWLYYVMYKPAGYVTTRADERGRDTVDDLLGRLRGRIFPIGRLDRATEGLLLFTNNGELAERLLHPRFQHERTYVAWVTPAPNLHTLRLIEAGGVPIGRGGYSGPTKVRLIGRRHDPARVRITLREGKYREVRRIFRAFDLRVLVLRRISFAGLILNDIEPGKIRPLTELERALLAKRSGLEL
jgi:23S rRNA pseudouridine2605 synthase